jgi:hypothetical protein
MDKVQKPTTIVRTLKIYDKLLFKLCSYGTIYQVRQKYLYKHRHLIAHNSISILKIVDNF